MHLRRLRREGDGGDADTWAHLVSDHKKGGAAMQARRVSERKGVRGPAADSAAGPHLELGHQAEQGGETSSFFFYFVFQSFFSNRN